MSPGECDHTGHAKTVRGLQEDNKAAEERLK